MNDPRLALGIPGARSLTRAVLGALFPAFAILLGLNSLPPPAPASPEHAPPPARTETPVPPPTDCQKRFLEPFQLLTGQPTQPPEQATPDWPTQVAEIHDWLRASFGAPVRVEVLIATLPDPVDSGLRYQFDAQLQALRLGIEAPAPGRALWSAQGAFNRDRDWLPWEDRGVKSEARAGSQLCRRELPGVILFRGSDRARPSLLALLLVGESPINGVHVRAAREAIRLATVLQHALAHLTTAPDMLRGPQAPRIGILGPTFSGGAQSLRHAIDAVRREGMCAPVDVISATASGPDVATIMRRRPVDACDSTTYRATTVTEQAIECTFLYYARRAGARVGVGDHGTSAVDGVAILQESGTEFGAALAGRSDARGPATGCRLQAEIQLSFPFHISSVRDAYEELDNRPGSRGRSDPAIARHTALEISLREDQRLDIEPPASRITKYAQDLALSNVLAEISREGVRWVGIQATDMADAVFLARKIRDVAPDVRLAFFTADALLLHPAFRADLLGSLVVTPYPFLGSDDFWPRKRVDALQGAIVQHAHASFASAEAEATFNAARALRGVDADDLTEYAFIAPAADEPPEWLQPLPIWIAALGRSGLVPIQARPALDCDGVIYGGAKPPADLCGAGRRGGDAWNRFNMLRGLQLNVDPDVTPPRLWNFVFAALLLVSILHWRFQRRVRAELGALDYPSMRFTKERDLTVDDALLDRCVVRTKWSTYALFAQTTLLLATLYMAAVYAIAASTYALSDSSGRLISLTTVSLGAVVLALIRTSRDARRVVRDLLAFRRLLRSTEEPMMLTGGWPSPVLTGGRGWGSQTIPQRLGSLLLWLGFADTRAGARAVYVSYAQMRTMCCLGGIVAVLFVSGVAWSLSDATDYLEFGGEAVPAMTLFVLRSLPLSNGVSPAVPLLLSLICTYWWAAGRMARLRLAFGLCQLSPSDGVTDCVSTPIRAVLYPRHGVTSADEGFTARERTLMNTILRPSGLEYFGSLSLITALPVVLFVLKHPTTLESKHETYLLFAVLGLCATLVAATLVQLLLYWSALDDVLKHIMQHPLAQAFGRLPQLFRESVDTQVSNSPDEVFRLAACAQAGEVLSMGPWAQIERSFQPVEPGRGTSATQNTETSTEALRQQALGQGQTLRPGPERLTKAPRDSDALAKLGQHVVEDARKKCALLMDVYEGQYPAAASLPGSPAPADATAATETLSRSLAALPIENDRLAVLQPVLLPGHYAWLRGAETYVASVVAFLLNRHVQQFRHFLYATTGCVLILLLAIASYPFEPQRTLMTCIWLLTGAVVLAGLWIYIQLDRDALLSAIAGDRQSAGKLTWNKELAHRIVIWVLLPILGLMAAQYPAFANHLSLLLEPFTRVLR